MLATAWSTTLRGMARRPYFAIVALVGTALTLATILTGVAFLEHTFAPTAPMSRGDRIVGIFGQRLSGPTNTSNSGAGWAVLEPALANLAEAEAIAVYRSGRRTEVWVGSTAVPAFLKDTNAGFWKVLDFKFLEGQPWDEGVDTAGSRVAVISRNLADNLFEGSAVGERFEVDGRSFQVVGVVENVSVTRRIPHADVWVPLTSARSDGWRAEMRDGLSALMLVRDRDDIPALRAAVAANVARIPVAEPFDTLEVWVDSQFEDASREIFGPDEAHTERFIAVLVLAAFAFMALPALNLVTLSMSRTLERAAEIGVRRAFGASRGDLVTQLLLETLVLTAFGAVIAVVLAQGSLMALASAGWVPGSTITIGPRTLAITGLVTVVFALLSGALPAWRMARLDPVVALSGRTTR